LQSLPVQPPVIIHPPQLPQHTRRTVRHSILMAAAASVFFATLLSAYYLWPANRPSFRSNGDIVRGSVPPNVVTVEQRGGLPTPAEPDKEGFVIPETDPVTSPKVVVQEPSPKAKPNHPAAAP